MLKHSSRSRMNSVKKKALEKSILQDMNFLSLKDFYNSIPDYSEINHLPEREFYREIDILKRKQQQLTECKKTKPRKQKSDKSSSRSSHHFDFALNSNEYETKRNYTERISFADDGNSISSWQLEYDGTITCKKRDQPNGSRLSSATSRPRTSRAESRCRKKQPSQLSNVIDDYEMLNSLRNYRSKSISPTRSQLNDCKYQKQLEEENKFYSDITQDKMKSVDHTAKKDPIKNIPITSKIPLFKQVMEDKEHKSHLAKLDSAIKLQSQMKPFHFHETKASARRCLSRSRSTPQLRGLDDSDNEEPDDDDACPFKAKPFPKNLFCNYVHYKMWEDNYFRALSKKLRAEELLKLSKLPPSMAKREEEKKKTEKLDELELSQLQAMAHAKQSVEFSPTAKKKKFRKKLRKSKSAIGGTRSQFSKSYIFDTKRDRDKGSVKSDGTTTTNMTKHRETPCDKISPSPIYPVNRPNLAATLRYEWSREKIKRYKEVKENMMRDKFRKPSWGVKNMHAFQQLAHETSNDEEIAIRLATRKAEQKLRQEEHEMNMAMMKQRVKTAPLLLEGPTQLSPRLGHIYHHCDIDNEKNKFDKLMHQNSHHLLKPPQHHHKSHRPSSTISTDSKITESSYNNCTET